MYLYVYIYMYLYVYVYSYVHVYILIYVNRGHHQVGAMLMDYLGNHMNALSSSSRSTGQSSGAYHNTDFRKQRPQQLNGIYIYIIIYIYICTYIYIYIYIYA
jgi:hypothetical protein